MDIYVANEQAAPLSQVCDVWAPSYRSQTWPSVEKGLAGDEAIMRSTFTVAYDSVLPAWQWFLAHTNGKPIILVGDSQGSAILIHLISAQLDHEPSVLRRLLVAILVGGNLQVPVGKTAGATFTNVPLCTAGTQTGCAIAFSSYPSQPPPDSVFGRPGQGVSLQSGQTAKAGQQVACVNPAALNGGTGDLDPYLLTVSQTAQFPVDSARLTEPVSTPWVTYPGLYSASCEQGGGATWLQVTSLAGTSRTRPVVNDDTEGQLGRYRPGVGLPRLRVLAHPGQPAPRRRRPGGRLAVGPLMRPAGRALRPDAEHPGTRQARPRVFGRCPDGVQASRRRSRQAAAAVRLTDTPPAAELAAETWYGVPDPAIAAPSPVISTTATRAHHQVERSARSLAAHWARTTRTWVHRSSHGGRGRRRP